MLGGVAAGDLQFPNVVDSHDHVNEFGAGPNPGPAPDQFRPGVHPRLSMNIGYRVIRQKAGQPGQYWYEKNYASSYDLDPRRFGTVPYHKPWPPEPRMLMFPKEMFDVHTQEGMIFPEDKCVDASALEQSECDAFTALKGCAKRRIKHMEINPDECTQMEEELMKVEETAKESAKHYRYPSWNCTFPYGSVVGGGGGGGGSDNMGCLYFGGCLKDQCTMCGAPDPLGYEADDEMEHMLPHDPLPDGLFSDDPGKEDISMRVDVDFRSAWT